MAISRQRRAVAFARLRRGRARWLLSGPSSLSGPVGDLELNLIPLRFLQGLVFLSLSFSLGILLGNNHREKLFTANWHLLCVDSPPFTEISALARA
ncbi:hypothetical protein AV530_014454 [Patagioenas fasciata monilis]|uniref:Uncharacterized protein n=1 Tax=Patagioenas fasciata monilis TaxID=372326 RepID=A0A1V4KC00_PATFA|nr:hypothetical protein AV530_014454 [Patagioenas fasciata monilis]